ncbi:MAG TPA: prepilin-type N-terminal cleavage/methylation domain-containing protein [candidate division Zixibacteria bacterium]|nr:prepilin-type N-terminal cleavage/methylation domain-containing protein [candidate division Zixibacteria bacterium]
MRDNPKIKRAEKGLTILEVLIAMVIMSVALLLLINMGMVALSGNDWSNKTTTAVQLLQQKLEELQGDPDPDSGSDEIDEFNRKWVVSFEENYLRRVQISVAWTDIQGSDRSESLTALIKSDSI